MVCKRILKLGAFALLLSANTYSVSLPNASELVYSPRNPSFGGNPLNSGHLLGIASAQREATASDFVDESATDLGLDSGSDQDSTAELFTRQLQSRLLSALAGQVTDAIFGDNPQDQGVVTFGDTTVSFERTLDSIRLTIADSLDGTLTEIVVPQLITGSN